MKLFSWHINPDRIHIDEAGLIDNLDEVMCALEKTNPMTKGLTPEDEALIAEMLEKMNRFATRETKECPHCGKTVKQANQVGRCVYLRPCGCRLWQGQVPDAWRRK